MLDGVEKLRIYPGQTGQFLSIELVGLTLATVDQPRLSGIGYKHLMPALFQKAAYPSRVGADLDGDLHLLCGVEAAVEIVRGSAQPTFLNELAAFGVEDAQITVLVTEVQPHRHLLRLLGANITHGSILLSRLLEPLIICRPSDRVLREDWPFSSHLFGKGEG